jgi:uroporphyrin-III C-methyltransferase/precorrin-2 dehydrogenase/sirohydrochlorin ferrochelatase
MIRMARRGRRVVRLKCGDPFLLGRGAEEALALAAAGVPFEVVPGVSSAIAAAELAGIPVTHRGLASGFVVVSGHAQSAYRPILESIAPGSLTVVVLMGMANRSAIAQLLRERGWPGKTPAAILLGASTPEAFTWLGSVEELGGATIPEESRSAPGTIVVGEVVTLAASLGEVEGVFRVAAGRC